MNENKDEIEGGNLPLVLVAVLAIGGVKGCYYILPTKTIEDTVVVSLESVTPIIYTTDYSLDYGDPYPLIKIDKYNSELSDRLMFGIYKTSLGELSKGTKLEYVKIKKTVFGPDFIEDFKIKEQKGYNNSLIE